jgi:hypothetical protein
MTAATARAAVTAPLTVLALALLSGACAAAPRAPRAGQGGSAGIVPASSTCMAVPVAASAAACAATGTVLAGRLSRSANPQFDDQYGQFVACLRVRGVMVHADPGNSGVSFDPGATAPDGTGTAAHECALQVFLTSP